MRLEPKSYEYILQNLHDGLYFVDKERVITYWNRGAEHISGFSASEVVGTSCAHDILTHVDGDGNNLCKGMCPLAACMADGKQHQTEIYMHHKDGHRIPVSVRVSPLLDEEGNVLGGIELFTDISSQAASALRVRELERLALLDGLTHLANRVFVEREIQNRFYEMRRCSVPFGILFIDVDHFKKVNDRHGHDVGDKVLKFVANAFVTNARPFDVYGRWGGEEFIGVLRNVGHEDLESLGNRLRLLIEKSYLTHGEENVSVTVSIGATVAEPGDTADSIIKRADMLLYQSKEEGRNRLTSG